MEETKKDEVQSNEEEKSLEKEESQTAALLEPTPYKRKAEKEETDDTATVSKDTASEEAATPDEERPVNAEEKVFKKRYEDIKRHYDSTLSKHKTDVLKLREQLEAK